MFGVVMKQDIIQDLKSFGGLPLSMVLILVSYFSGAVLFSLQLLIGFILSYALTVAIRLVYFKGRPSKVKFGNTIEKVDASSFPSLHAMRAGLLAVLCGLFFGNVFLWFLFALIAVVVAVVRVVQKRHFKVDVVAGLFFGILLALLSVWLSQRLI